MLHLYQVGLTGSLPSQCPDNSVLDRLLSFELAYANVTGVFPACLAAAQSVSLVATRVGGPLPAFPSTSHLSTLRLVQVRLRVYVSFAKLLETT
jgi:hypothetical protein